MDETYIKVRGEWRYLYRTVDKDRWLFLFHLFFLWHNYKHQNDLVQHHNFPAVYQERRIDNWLLRFLFGTLFFDLIIEHYKYIFFAKGVLELLLRYSHEIFFKTSILMESETTFLRAP